LKGRVFQLALLVATLLPFCMVTLPRSSDVLAVITAISLLGGTHVMATAYLFASPTAFVGVPHWQLTLVAAPLVLMAAVFVAVFAFPMWALVLFMLVYIHFGIWHFGRQNLGVVTFAVRISHGRPIDPFERRTIMAGVIAGMCAAYTAFAPSLMLNTNYFPIDAAWAAPIFSPLWYLGAVIYAALIPIALVHTWRNRQRYDPPSLALYLTSVLFFVPLFVTADPLIAVSSWAVAHGLQYLVFLAFHAGGRTRPSVGGMVPIATLLVAAGAGYMLWNMHPAWGPQLARIGASTVLAINLAHYWVDMFLWRFRTPERRRWLADGFPFLAGAPRAAHATATGPAMDGSELRAGT